MKKKLQLAEKETEGLFKTEEINTSQGKTSILNFLIPKIVTWYGKINFNWNEYLTEIPLQEIFKKAGYFYPGKSTLGLLKTEVAKKRIQEAIIKILPGENSTLLLRALIVLSGILDIREAVPLLFDVIIESRYDDKELVLIFKSLIMMKLDDRKLLGWFEAVEADNDENDELKLLHVRILMNIGTVKTAKEALDILERIKDVDIKRQGLQFLTDIHLQGIDTTGWLNFIIEDCDCYEYYDPIKAIWAKTVGTEKIFQTILNPDSNTELIVEIICQAIAQPKSWKLLYPILIKKREEWINDDIDSAIILAYMTLLGLWGEDLSDYIKETNSWTIQCGAYLAEAGRKTDRDYSSLYMTEIDNEIKYAIKLNMLLKKKSISTIEERAFLKQYNETEYNLPRLTRCLLSGYSRLDLFKDIATDFLMENTSDHLYFDDQLNGRSERLNELLTSKYENIFAYNFDFYSKFSANIMLFYLQQNSTPFHFGLENKFYDELDYSTAESLLLYTTIHNISFRSNLVQTKEKLHLISTNNLRLTTSEFESFYPLLFKGNLSEQYKKIIIKSSRASIETNPEKAFQLYRYADLEDDMKTLILPMNSSISSDPLSFELKNLSESKGVNANLKSIIQSHGASERFIPTVLNKFGDGQLYGTIAVDILIQCLYKTEDKITIRNILENLSGLVSPANFSDFLIQNCLSDCDRETRIAVAEFIMSHPSQQYFPLVFVLLKDDGLKVRSAAFETLKFILQELNLQEQVITLNNSAGNTEELFIVAQEQITNESEYESFIGKQYVIDLYDEQKLKSDLRNVVPQSIWQNIWLHLSIDFIDKNKNRVVGHIDENETGEILNWLLEQGDYLFYTVSKA